MSEIAVSLGVLSTYSIVATLTSWRYLGHPLAWLILILRDFGRFVE